jgi:hypothetical protein
MTLMVTVSCLRVEFLEDLTLGMLPHLPARMSADPNPTCCPFNKYSTGKGSWTFGTYVGATSESTFKEISFHMFACHMEWTACSKIPPSFREAVQL